MWPIGSIVSYNGDINDIPDGWLLCDGNNGTPDLSDRFIRGDFNVSKNGLWKLCKRCRIRSKRNR